MMATPEQSKKNVQSKQNVRLGLILASVAVVFAFGFFFKIMVLGR